MDYSIKPNQIYEILNNDATFIDLRDIYEYNEKHIKKFIHIPYDNIMNSLHLIKKDKPVYLLCDTGKRAKDICYELRKKGYQSYYIEGGFQSFLYTLPSKYQ